MKILWHVGLHKTGTTAIQHWLADNREALLGKGIYYGLTDEMERFKNHHLIASAIKAGHRDLARSQIESILSAAEAVGADCVLFSSEIMSEIRDRAGVDELFLGHEVNIIVSFRKPFTMWPSAYNQMVKDDRTRFTMPFTTDVYGINYQYIYDTWLSYQNVNRVIVFHFESGLENPNGIVGEFLGSIEISSDGLVLPNNIPHLNASMDARAIELLRHFNRYGLSADQRIKLIEFLNSAPFMELDKPIVTYDSEDVVRMRKIFDQFGKPFYEKHPCGEHALPDPDTGEVYSVKKMMASDLLAQIALPMFLKYQSATP